MACHNLCRHGKAQQALEGVFDHHHPFEVVVAQDGYVQLEMRFNLIADIAFFKQNGRGIDGSA